MLGRAAGPPTVRRNGMLMLSVAARQRGVEEAARPIGDSAAVHAALKKQPTVSRDGESVVWQAALRSLPPPWQRLEEY